MVKVEGPWEGEWDVKTKAQQVEMVSWRGALFHCWQPAHKGGSVRGHLGTVLSRFGESQHAVWGTSHVPECPSAVATFKDAAEDRETCCVELTGWKRQHRKRQPCREWERDGAARHCRINCEDIFKNISSCF